MKAKAIIFDLDGTLIDSADSILYGFDFVLKGAGCVSKVLLTRDLIGPPLKLTMQKLSGISDDAMLEDLVGGFKSYYDLVGYQKSTPYLGIDKLLEDLRASDQNLILATNKRMIPTKKILEHLGWASLFGEVYAIDRNTFGAYANKAEMLQSLIIDLNLDKSNSIYIGDRIDDQDAAHACGLSSITVDWGYGDYSDRKIYSKTVSSVENLAQILRNFP